MRQKESQHLGLFWVSEVPCVDRNTAGKTEDVWQLVLPHHLDELHGNVVKIVLHLIFFIDTGEYIILEPKYTKGIHSFWRVYCQLPVHFKKPWCGITCCIPLIFKLVLGLDQFYTSWSVLLLSQYGRGLLHCLCLLTYVIVIVRWCLCHCVNQQPVISVRFCCCSEAPLLALYQELFQNLL